jgi:hypothetical protein
LKTSLLMGTNLIVKSALTEASILRLIVQVNMVQLTFCEIGKSGVKCHSFARILGVLLVVGSWLYFMLPG